MLISRLHLLNKLLKRIKTTGHPFPHKRHGASRLVEIEIQVLAGIGESIVDRLPDETERQRHSDPPRIWNSCYWVCMLDRASSLDSDSNELCLKEWPSLL